MRDSGIQWLSPSNRRKQPRHSGGQSSCRQKTIPLLMWRQLVVARSDAMHTVSSLCKLPLRKMVCIRKRHDRHESMSCDPGKALFFTFKKRLTLCFCFQYLPRVLSTGCVLDSRPKTVVIHTTTLLKWCCVLGCNQQWSRCLTTGSILLLPHGVVQTMEHACWVIQPAAVLPEKCTIATDK